MSSNRPRFLVTIGGLAGVAVAMAAVMAPAGDVPRPLAVLGLLAAGFALVVARWGGGLSAAEQGPVFDDDSQVLATLDRELSRAARHGAATAVVRLRPNGGQSPGVLAGAVRQIVRIHDVVLECPGSGDVMVMSMVEDEAASKVHLDRLAAHLDIASIVFGVTVDRSESGGDLIDRLEPYVVGTTIRRSADGRVIEKARSSAVGR